MNKNKELLLEMIYRTVGIEFLDLSYGDSKYLLSNMIAKYSNSGEIYLSQKVKDILDRYDFPSFGNIKYRSKFYGKTCSFYKKHKIQFVAEHTIPCGILLDLILDSDKTKETIREILDYNKVVMILKEEDLVIQKMGLRDKVCNDFNVKENIWGRYKECGIIVTENYFNNIGPIFR